MRTLTWKQKLLFGFSTFLVFLVLAELSLRVFDVVRGGSVQARTSWFWGYEQDGLLDYRARPNVEITYPGNTKEDTNSEGFRDVDIPIEPEGERRLIICMGESSTWGVKSSDRYHTYPRFLQEELKRAAPEEPFATMNAGFPSYTLVHNLQLLQLRLLKYKPEAILYMGFHNDCQYYVHCLENEVDYNFYPRRLAFLPDTWVNRTLMRSSLFGFLTDRLLRLNSQSDFQDDREARATPRGEALFRDEIALMKLLCQRHGIKLIWVDQVIDQSKVTAKQMELFDCVRIILHDELRRQDIPLVQAHKRFDHAATPMADAVHLTDSGNAQLAKIIASQLLELLQKHESPKPVGDRPFSGKESSHHP